MLQPYFATKRRLVIGVAVTAFACSLFWPVDLAKYNDESPTLYDRNGELIHIERNAHDRWVLKVQTVDVRFKELLLNFEDKWFYVHPGVNPFAVARALVQAVIHKKILSGGSTITMQVARLLSPGPRTLWKKCCEVHTALRLTTQYSKESVLKMYLTLAPYGGNIHGIRAASLHYFGKEPNFLPLSYKAMLVAIPQSPSRLRPDRFIEKANNAKNKVLQRMGSSPDIKEALGELCQINITPFIKLAPHAFRLKVPILLDKSYQEAIATFAFDYVEKLPAPMSAACVVYDLKADQILVYIGGVGGACRMDGNDMCRAIRSPGSLLKPFIYGLAMERGYINPQTLITDKPINLKGYMPENFDMVFCGDMTIEEALQQSLNTPVIQVLDQIGPGYFFDWLKQKQVAIHFPAHNNKRPGLAIGLGGVGMSLFELVCLYGKLAKGTLLNKPSQVWVTQTLALTPMPDQRIKNPGIAYKTGTSYGFRDAWSIGYDNQYVVGIWVGRADGTPCPGYHGRQIAAPLMMQVFNYLGANPILISEQNSSSQQRLRFQTHEKQDFLISMPKKSTTLCVPVDEVVYLQTNSSDIVLWYVNGTYLGESKTAYSWTPANAGFYQITAMNTKNSIDTCNVEIRREP